MIKRVVILILVFFLISFVSAQELEPGKLLINNVFIDYTFVEPEAPLGGPEAPLAPEVQSSSGEEPPVVTKCSDCGISCTKDMCESLGNCEFTGDLTALLLYGTCAEVSSKTKSKGKSDVTLAGATEVITWKNNIEKCSSAGCKALSKPETCDETNIISDECQIDKDCVECRKQFGVDKECVTNSADTINLLWGPVYFSEKCYTGIGTGADVSQNRDYWYTACDCSVDIGSPEESTPGVWIPGNANIGECSDVTTLNDAPVECKPLTSYKDNIAGYCIGCEEKYGRASCIEGNAKLGPSVYKYTDGSYSFNYCYPYVEGVASEPAPDAWRDQMKWLCECSGDFELPILKVEPAPAEPESGEIVITGKTEVTITNNIQFSTLDNIKLDVFVIGTKTGNLDIQITDENPVDKVGTGIGIKIPLNKFITIDSDLEITKATIKIPYNEDELGTIQESSLRVYYYDEANAQWQILANSGVNTDDNYVYGDITHFSVHKVAVFGDKGVDGVEIWYMGDKCSKIPIGDFTELSELKNVKCLPLDDPDCARCKTHFETATCKEADPVNGPYYNPLTPNDGCYPNPIGEPKDNLPFGGLGSYYKGCMCTGEPAQRFVLPSEDHFIIWKESTVNCADITHVDSMRDDGGNIDKRDDRRTDDRVGYVKCTGEFLDSGCKWCKEFFVKEGMHVADALKGIEPDCNVKYYDDTGGNSLLNNLHGKGPGYSIVDQNIPLHTCYSGTDAPGGKGTTASYESSIFYKECLCEFQSCTFGDKREITNDINTYEECMLGEDGALQWIRIECSDTEQVVVEGGIRCETSPDLSAAEPCIGSCSNCLTEQPCWATGKCSWKRNKNGDFNDYPLCVNSISDIDSYPTFEKNGHKYQIAAAKHNPGGIDPNDQQTAVNYYCPPGYEGKYTVGKRASSFEELAGLPDLILFPTEEIYGNFYDYYTKIDCELLPEACDGPEDIDIPSINQIANRKCDGSGYKKCIHKPYETPEYDWGNINPCPYQQSCEENTGNCIPDVPITGCTPQCEASAYYDPNKWTMEWCHYDKSECGGFGKRISVSVFGKDEYNLAFDNNWGSGQIGITGKSDYVGFKANRKVCFTNSESTTYTFTVSADDYAVVKVDNRIKTIGPTTQRFTIEYAAGNNVCHNFDIEYYDQSGDGKFSFSYTYPGYIPPTTQPVTSGPISITLPEFVKDIEISPGSGSDKYDEVVVKLRQDSFRQFIGAAGRPNIANSYFDLEFRPSAGDSILLRVYGHHPPTWLVEDGIWYTRFERRLIDERPPSPYVYDSDPNLYSFPNLNTILSQRGPQTYELWIGYDYFEYDADTGRQYGPLDYDVKVGSIAVS